MKYPDFLKSLLSPSTQALRRTLTLILVLCASVLAPVSSGRADDVVRVMTRNLYQGTSFDAVVAAPTLPALFAAAGQAFQNIVASKPAERAAAVAREIDRNHVDIVGLQEAIILRKGPSQLAGPFTPANEVVVDGLRLLLDGLERLNEPFEVVAVVPGLDAQIPTLLGFDARLTVRTVIIARSRGSDLKLSNVQVQGFLNNLPFPTAGGPVINTRGWASVDVEVHGRKFRLATTHLEADDATVRRLQATDMIASAGNTALPTIFLADFNVAATTPADTTYGQFLTAGFVDAWAQKRPLDPGFTCCQAANLLNTLSQLSTRIDLVLFRGAFRVEDIRLVGEKPGDKTPSGLWPSDHAGVVATLRLPKSH